MAISVFLWQHAEVIGTLFLDFLFADDSTTAWRGLLL